MLFNQINVQITLLIKKRIILLFNLRL